MNQVIYVVSKNPVSMDYIPPKLKGHSPLVNKYEVIKRTAKGYRLKVSYAPEKGSMYLEDHYAFFATYSAALEYIASESNRVAGELEEMKLNAIRLMCEAQDELRQVRSV